MPDATWSVFGVGVMNGDGRRDILLHQQGCGKWTWEMNAAADINGGGWLGSPDAGSHLMG